MFDNACMNVNVIYMYVNEICDVCVCVCMCSQNPFFMNLPKQPSSYYNFNKANINYNIFDFELHLDFVILTINFDLQCDLEYN